MTQPETPVDRPFRWFRDDLCDHCGRCFEECPVLGLPLDAAKADVEALTDGRPADSLAFRFCTTCNLCDSVCPQQADPYELILESFDRYRSRHGFPFMAKMVLPNEPENVWSALRLLMEEDELSCLREWEENLNIPRREILLTGFYTNIVPFLATGSALEELRAVMLSSLVRAVLETAFYSQDPLYFNIRSSLLNILRFFFCPLKYQTANHTPQA